ncbi:hypothetical protein CTAYLR_006883 [Chrysophaeum taylorii]|uniref:Alpha-type protein kinase domain-containing protein n=1 Tax=Chrysophaeum taylorii TaxID=2483200 RepID=A0AAD7UFQ3_9STRA|nr:hypothetical protein CTAYLR_006883 [Chrysophaeum taylorii]
MVSRREVQEAIRFGRRERANPGRLGEKRWRYSHKGSAFVIDQQQRLVTWWRCEDTEDELPANVTQVAGPGVAVVLVVDASSGSHRANDPRGTTTTTTTTTSSRLAVAYECIAREFVGVAAAEVSGASATVTLIEMSDRATVVARDAPLDASFCDFLRKRAEDPPQARARGRYLPALDAAVETLASHAATKDQFFLLFLSDGAPSDHKSLSCLDHGVQVWQSACRCARRRRASNRDVLQTCPTSATCRRLLHDLVRGECARRVAYLGDVLGRDRFFVATIGIGSRDEDYAVLRDMARAIPRNSFQTLVGLPSLRTALADLTASFAESLRAARAPRPIPAHPSPRSSGEKLGDLLLKETDFDVYERPVRRRWCCERQGFVEIPASSKEATGIARAKTWFSRGSERYVFHATEVETFQALGRASLCRRYVKPVGPKLVAKQPMFDDFRPDYHSTLCRVHARASALADDFNRLVDGPAAMTVSYLQPTLFQASTWLTFVVEPELEGKFTKWNDNSGRVRESPLPRNDDGGGLKEFSSENVDDVPQAFSHFTHHATNGQLLVCDVQGVWNQVDGFALTDPAIHSRGPQGRRNGPTDAGDSGIARFFKTHRCNALCRHLGLAPPLPAEPPPDEHPFFLPQTTTAAAATKMWEWDPPKPLDDLTAKLDAERAARQVLEAEHESLRRENHHLKTKLQAVAEKQGGVWTPPKFRLLADENDPPPGTPNDADDLVSARHLLGPLDHFRVSDNFDPLGLRDKNKNNNNNNNSDARPPLLLHGAASSDAYAYR